MTHTLIRVSRTGCSNFSNIILRLDDGTKYWPVGAANPQDDQIPDLIDTALRSSPPYIYDRVTNKA